MNAIQAALQNLFPTARSSAIIAAENAALVHAGREGDFSEKLQSVTLLTQCIESIY